MRRRHLLVYMSLFATVVAALAVGLAVTVAVRNTQEVYIDRQGDTARFAALAETPLRTGRAAALRNQLAGHDSLYGIAAAVLNRDGAVVVASRDGLTLDEHARRHVEEALAGETAGSDHILWPWHRTDLVVVEPIGRDGEVIGAALTVSPTGAARAGVLRWWAWLAAGSLLAIGLSGLVAWPITGWILRPVRELDDAAHAIAEGRLSARVQHAAGPPELRRLGASFNTMADTIATLVDRQRMFVSYASHQLRNPLAALRLRVENLAVHLDQSAGAGGEDHALTVDEVDRLTRICDGLLAVARADAERAEPVVVDAALVADERVAAWLPVARRAGVRLRRDGAPAAPVLVAADVVDQVLDTLLDNAIKFGGTGSTATVAVGSDPAGWVTVDVIDDGPGLPGADLAAATRPYWRDPGHRDRAGSGLGLAIVVTLVEASGGRVELHPAQPHGLHARLCLPAA